MGEKPYTALRKILFCVCLKTYLHWASKALLIVVFKQGYFVLLFLHIYHW